ncbi:MAG: c-type cytochrome [Hyphomicrobiaceae bacterium]
MSSTLRLLLAAAMFGAGASAAGAGGNAADGAALAKKLCTSCHIVAEDTAQQTVSADVPSFPSIAQLEGQTAERIAGRIVLPHPPMPQIQLTRQEIADLSAYIMSLKPE